MLLIYRYLLVHFARCFGLIYAKINYEILFSITFTHLRLILLLRLIEMSGVISLESLQTCFCVRVNVVQFLTLC